MALLALDCMHLTQTRIATIDSFPVLFIMMSFFFMLRFMQRDLMAGMKPMLTDLAWSGVSIGLGIASKWIGLYAGAGLAVLFFWTCWRHIRLSYQAKELLSTAGGLSRINGRRSCSADRKTLTRLVWLCLWCVCFSFWYRWQIVAQLHSANGMLWKSPRGTSWRRSSGCSRICTITVITPA